MHLYQALETKTFYITFETFGWGRSSHTLFQIPLVLLMQFTDNVLPLYYAYGILYCFTPFLTAWGCYHLLHKKYPYLYTIAATAICLTPLLAQFFVISGHIIVCQFFWLLLALLINVDSWKRVCGIVGIVFLLLFFHPVTPVLFGYISVCLFCFWRFGKQKKPWHLAVSILFIGLGITKVLMVNGMEKMGYGTFSNSMKATFLASENFPYIPREGAIVYLLCVILIGLLFASNRPRIALLQKRLTLFCAALFLLWGFTKDPLDSNAVFYNIALTTEHRNVVFLLQLPFLFSFVLCFLRMEELRAISRKAIASYAGILFALTFAIFGTLFAEDVRAMQSNKKGCNEWGTINSKPSTIDFWGLPTLTLLLDEQKTVDRIIWDNCFTFFKLKCYRSFGYSRLKSKNHFFEFKSFQKKFEHEYSSQPENRISPRWYGVWENVEEPEWLIGFYPDGTWLEKNEFTRKDNTLWQGLVFRTENRFQFESCERNHPSSLQWISKEEILYKKKLFRRSDKTLDCKKYKCINFLSPK